jgi:hypothetical protein
MGNVDRLPGRARSKRRRVIAWRSLVHKLGFDMTRHFTMSKGEVRIEMWTKPDGETLEHAELYKFGDLSGEIHFVPHDDIAKQIYSWLEHDRA